MGRPGGLGRRDGALAGALAGVPVVGLLVARVLVVGVPVVGVVVPVTPVAVTPVPVVVAVALVAVAPVAVDVDPGGVASAFSACSVDRNIALSG